MKAEFTTAINLLSQEKGVPPEVVVEALESALVSAYKRNFNDANLNVTAQIDRATGAAKVLIEKTAVSERPIEPNEISLEDAQTINPDAQIGDAVWQDVTPQSFGRIAAQTAKQHIVQKLREAERKRVYDEFSERAGEILHGLVQRIEQRTVIMELGKTEAVMPLPEQVPTERYYPGQRLRVYLVEVHDSPKGPQLLVSRAHKMMIKRLFEQEVPEIFSGTVEIKAIAREPGARSKVAVCAHQEGVDPVGSCVGMRGVRIQNIVTELSGEKIDVIPWDPDPAKFVASALSPAQVQRVGISEEDKTATVIVPERQLSLAIGREGQNARLAARLTGWRIDIKSDVAVARAELEAEAAAADAEAAAVAAVTEAPVRKSRARKTAASEEAAPAVAVAEAPVRKSRARKNAASEEAAPAVAVAEAPVRKSRARKNAASEEAAPAAVVVAEAPSKTRVRASRAAKAGK